MKKTVLYLSLIIFSLPIFSQNAKLDSLENVLANHPKTDTVKIKLLTVLAFNLNNIDAEKSLQYAMLADSLSDILHYKKGKADSNNVIGIYYYYKSDYKLALKYYHIGLKISEEIKDRKLTSRFFNNIGVIYMFQSKYDTALLYYGKKLKTDIESKDTMEMCITYNNFGIVYHYKGDYPRAMEYYQKTLALGQKIKDKNQISGAYGNIGIIYKNLGEYANALEYYKKAYQLEVELDNKFAISRMALSVGTIYSKMNNLSKALEYYEESLKSSLALDYKFNTSIAYGNIGGIYLKQNNYPKALEYIKKGLALAEEVGSKNYILGNNIDLCNLYYKQKKYSLAIAHGEKAYKMAVEIDGKEKIKDASDILAKVYAAMGNYEKAYKYHVEFKNNSDSIYNESNIKEITNIENQYKFEKEKEAIADEQAKKDIIQAEELKRQKVVRNSFIGGFLLMIVFALIIFRNLTQKRKANRLLGEQKAEIEAQKDEIQTQAEDLNEKNHYLEQLSNFKKMLTGTLVHDLKNPLNYIIGSTHDKAIRQSGYNMLNIVLNVLDVNKAQSTKLSVNFENCKVEEIIVKAVSQVEYLAEEKNLIFETILKKQVVIKADKNLTTRILVNLLTNAIKYSPLNNKITIQVEVKNKSVTIDVIDYGIGICEEDVQFLFKEYSQIEAQNSGKIQSTGLGLTFCKLATEAQNAKIDVCSTPNKKTRFSLVFPLIAVSEKAIEEKIETPKEDFLTEEEKELLLPVLQKFNQMETFQASKILKLLSTIEEETDNIKCWKQKVKGAMLSTNDELFKKLIQYGL